MYVHICMYMMMSSCFSVSHSEGVGVLQRIHLGDGEEQHGALGDHATLRRPGGQGAHPHPDRVRRAGQCMGEGTHGANIRHSLCQRRHEL